MKKTRILIAICATVVMAFALAGCGGGSSETETTDKYWAKIQETGVWKIGTEGAWAPYIYNDEDNNLLGFDVDWVEAIAKEMGVKTEWDVASSWDGVVAGLDADRYDCVFCQVAPTDYSSDKYLMTDPYATSRSVIVVDKDNNDINTLDDFDGKIAGNSPQGVWGQIAAEHGADVRNMNLTEAMNNIKTGRIDFSINAEGAIMDYLKTSGDEGVKIAFYYEPEDPAEELIVGLFPMGSDELVANVNKAINKLLQDGTAEKISEKYFGANIYEDVDLLQYSTVEE